MAVGFIIVIVIVLAAASLPGVEQPRGGETLPVASPPATTPITPPVHRTMAAPVTSSPVATPIPSPTVACTPAGTPGFTVTVSPVETTAQRGTTVVYHMTIDAQNCFSENVTMQLVASAYFGLVSQTVDLGVQVPPYPKTIEYPFSIPGTWPAGITVDGLVKSTGDGISRENRLTLHAE